MLTVQTLAVSLTTRDLVNERMRTLKTLMDDTMSGYDCNVVTSYGVSTDSGKITQITQMVLWTDKESNYYIFTEV